MSNEQKYIATRPRLLFSYPGKPPVLTGAKEINELGADDQKGWRYIHEYCGGNQTTKRIAEGKLIPIVGPLDWGTENLDTPLDLGKFFGEVAKLQNGQRWAALCWAHAHIQGYDVQADPKSVLTTRTAFHVDTTIRSLDEIQAEANAIEQAARIKSLEEFLEAQAFANREELRIRNLASEFDKNREHILPQIAKLPVELPAGRTPVDVAMWRRVFDFVDEDDVGTVSKHQVQARLAPLIGPFHWDDDHDDTPLSFNEFVEIMNSAVPSDKRYSTLTWARNTCPARVYPIEGGKHYYSRQYL